MTEAPAPERPLRAAAWLAAVAPALLGTIGAAWADLRVEFSCADHFSCGDLTCPPCAASLHWVLAGFIGEWILAAAVTALFIAGRRHAERQQATTLARAALLPVAIIWYIATTTAATSWLT